MTYDQQGVGRYNRPVQADRYKTRMCDKWAAGNCPYDVRCMFAHGEEELRTADDNIRDGLLTEEAIRQYRIQYYGPSCFRRGFRQGRLYSPSEYSSYMGFQVDQPSVAPPAYESLEFRHHPYVNVLDHPLYLNVEEEEEEEFVEEYFPAEEMSSELASVWADLPYAQTCGQGVKEPIMYAEDCGDDHRSTCGVVEP